MERSLAQAQILDLQLKIDTTLKELGKTKAELEIINREVQKKNRDIEFEMEYNDLLKQRCISLNNECVSLKCQFDSVAIDQSEVILLPLEPEMVYVAGGVFRMGNNSRTNQEKPVHSVTLSSFNIGKYEVTQALWTSIMKSNPSGFSGCNDCPVENVSWESVQEFIRELNSYTGKKYRLPTEAEWEYAAKGGKKGKGYFYSGNNELNTVAWWGENSGRKTHVVGTRRPNELGIFDMSGNVNEWCSDWYGKYSSHNQTNPKGPAKGFIHVSRGGCWSDFGNGCRITSRAEGAPDFTTYYSGFRLVLPVNP